MRERERRERRGNDTKPKISHALKTHFERVHTADQERSICGELLACTPSVHILNTARIIPIPKLTRSKSQQRRFSSPVC
jgi:hypothetical protein